MEALIKLQFDDMLHLYVITKLFNDSCLFVLVYECFCFFVSKSICFSHVGEGGQYVSSSKYT